MLLFETFKLLSSYTFRLPARRFILSDLFTVQFDPVTLKIFDQVSCELFLKGSGGKMGVFFSPSNLQEFHSNTSDERLLLLLKEEQEARKSQ